MKVLMIGQLPKEIGGSYTTGVANVVYELSRHANEGITYYTYGTNLKDKDAKAHSEFKNQYLGYKIRPLHIALSFLCHPFRRIKEWKQYKEEFFESPIRYEIYRDNFERLIKELKPDILNIHGQGIAPLYNANKKYRIPLVQTFHGVSNAEDEEAKRNRPREIAGAKLADYATCLTDEIKEFCIKTFGISKDKIVVIPNGCDTKKFYFSPEQRSEIRKAMNVPDDMTIFITASTVIRRKGQLAFSKIMEVSEGKAQYWIIGKGPDWQNVKDYCDEHNIGDRVKFLGYVANTDLYKYHSAADVFVHASEREAQALCEIEAYSCGLKILVNNMIKSTIPADISDSSIYYIADFSQFDLVDFEDWSKIKLKRHSRKHADWSNIVYMYISMFSELIKKK